MPIRRCVRQLTSAYWVRALWGVLDRLTDNTSRPAPSVLSGGSGMTATSGSASTRVITAQSAPTGTTDDAVVATAGGMSAPLVHRDSRRLAPKRSIRRAASDLDLRTSDAEQLIVTRSEGPSSYHSPRSQLNPRAIAPYPASSSSMAHAFATFTVGNSSFVGRRSPATLSPFSPSTAVGPRSTGPCHSQSSAHSSPNRPAYILEQRSLLPASHATSELDPSVMTYTSDRLASGTSGYTGSESSVSSSLSATAFSGPSRVRREEIETIDVSHSRPRSYPMSAPSEIVIPGASWPPRSGSSGSSPPEYTTDAESLGFNPQLMGTERTAATGDFGSPAPIFDDQSSLGLPSLAGDGAGAAPPLTPTSEYSAWPSGDSTDSLSLVSAELQEPMPHFRAQDQAESGFREPVSSPRSGSATGRGRASGSSTASPGRHQQSQGTSATATPRWTLRDLGPGSTTEASAYLTPSRPGSVVGGRPRSSPPSHSSGASEHHSSVSNSHHGHVSRHSTGATTPGLNSERSKSRPPGSHRSPPALYLSHQPAHASSHSDLSGLYHPPSEISRHSDPGFWSSSSQHPSQHSSHLSEPSSLRSVPSFNHSTSSAHESSSGSHPSGQSTHYFTSHSRLFSPPDPRSEQDARHRPYSLHLDGPAPRGAPSSPSSSGPSSSGDQSGPSSDTTTSKQRGWSSSSRGYESAHQSHSDESPLTERLSSVVAPLTSGQPVKALAMGIGPPSSEAENERYYTAPTDPSSTGSALPTNTARDTSSTATSSHDRPSTAGSSFVKGRSSQYGSVWPIEPSASLSSHTSRPSSTASSPASPSDTGPPFGTPPFVSAVPVSPGWSTHRGLPSYAPTEVGSALPSRAWSERGTTPVLPEQRSMTPQSVVDVEVADLERMSSMGSNVSRITEAVRDVSRRATSTDSRGYQTASEVESFATGTVAYTTAQGTRYSTADTLL